jgi:hypothetical protein
VSDTGSDPETERLDELGEHIDDARRSAEIDDGPLDEPDERTLNDPEGDGDEGIDGAVPA